MLNGKMLARTKGKRVDKYYILKSTPSFLTMSFYSNNMYCTVYRLQFYRILNSLLKEENDEIQVVIFGLIKLK
jgi:hypothetical protein